MGGQDDRTAPADVLLQPGGQRLHASRIERGEGFI